MNNFANILTTIRRPFQQERRKGYRDDVVVNGLGNYVQLWVKNGDALGLAGTEKEVLHSLADLFKNYTNASPIERQRTLEEATKRIDTALGHKQQVHSGLETSHTSRKNAQTAALPLFQEQVNRSNSAPPKQEPITAPITQRAAKETLPLFQTPRCRQHQPKTPRRRNPRSPCPSQMFPFQPI